MSNKKLYSVAKKEIAAWNATVPRALVMMILFAFIHRLTTGESVEETFLAPAEPPIDYEI